MRGVDARTASKRRGHRIAYATIGQAPALTTTINGNRRKQARDRRAGPDRLVQAHAVGLICTEISRLPAGQIVTDDAETLNAVVKPIESRDLELTKPARDHPAPTPYAPLVTVIE